jgi:GNAT superfamily N-acetyltransferase/RimJ/RimL family protein N-acetyltransferase
VRIERFDPRADEERLRACHEMVTSGRPQDDPNAPPESFSMFRGWWIYGFSADPQQIWLATSDSGAQLGCYVLELPERENRSNGFCFPVVGLASRRRGVGTALVAHAAEQAELAGRTLLMSRSRVGAPGFAFAAAAGARPGMRDVRRVLDVGPDLPARLAGLRRAAQPHAAGYALRRWSGATPADLVSQTCALYTALGDAPHDAAFEPASWDAERLRAAEQRVIAQRARWYSVAAMHDATGQMAALTQVNVDPDVPDWAFQEITAVTRQHRGHRLGLLIKIAMLEWLARLEPQVREIMTFNAEPNEHMIAVNAQLGHRVTDYFQSFEFNVAAARKLAAHR